MACKSGSTKTFRLLINSTLTLSKNLPVFTLQPEANSQIFLLIPFRVGVKQEKNLTPNLICQSRIIAKCSFFYKSSFQEWFFTFREILFRMKFSKFFA